MNVTATREREAELLAELVRLAPATVLVAESGSDKSGFLANTVLPLLAVSAAGETEVCILFDSWDDAPLPKLLAQIRRAVPALDSRRANEKVPSSSLAATLARWQHGIDATFIIVFDRFEEHLAARDRPGAAEFEEELVRVMKMPALRAHFVIALEADDAPLLDPLRERIPGLGDTVIRLPPPPVPRAREPDVRPGLLGSAAKTESLVGSAPAAKESPVGSAPSAMESPAGSAPEIALESVEETAAAPAPAAAAPAVATETAPAAAPLPEPRGETPTVVERTSGLPRAAWALLGLLLFSALGLLLLTLWQPKPPVDVAVPTGQPAPTSEASGAPVADASLDAAGTQSPPPSPADDQVALPLIKDEVPRAAPAAAPVAKSPPAAAAAKAPAAEPAAAPRATTMVYVHVRSEAQRAWAERLVQPLARKGIRVTGIRVVKAGPSEADLRYFRAQESREAARVARALREAGVPPPRVKRVPGLESQSKPHQFELWLPPGTPKPPRQHP